jgi:pimeloyl-ACP methyl ester carboxylesterase
MPYADVNGQRLYYEDTGGTGPVIVFSHGLLLDGTMFAPQVAAMRDKYRCIVWDERGHGKTAGETLAPFSYYDSANDVAALLAFLGVDSAILTRRVPGCVPGDAMRPDSSGTRARADPDRRTDRRR